MFENLALRLKAFLGLFEYLGNPNISQCTIIRRPLTGIEDLSPAQRRTRLLTSLAMTKTFHKAGYLTADGLPLECERIVKAAPETERRELVNIALPLGLQAYKHPKAPYKPPGMLIGMITSELYRWVHKDNYEHPMMSTENFAKQLLDWQRGLIRLLPESERLGPVNTALDFAKRAKEDGNIGELGFSVHLSYLIQMLPRDQRRELVDFQVELDRQRESELTSAQLLTRKVGSLWSLPEYERNKAAQLYDLWPSATVAWREFATNDNADALPALRDAFQICGTPPAETGITGVTVSETRLGDHDMVCAIFERTQGRPLAVIGSRVLNYDDMQILANDASIPAWMGRVDPAERAFIRQNLPKLSAPAAA